MNSYSILSVCFTNNEFTQNLFFSSGGNLSNVLHYQKPSSRPEPVLQPKPTVAEIKPACDNKHVKKSQLTELVYQIGRNFTEIPEPLPPWGPFHIPCDAHQRFNSLLCDCIHSHLNGSTN